MTVWIVRRGINILFCFSLILLGEGGLWATSLKGPGKRTWKVPSSRDFLADPKISSKCRELIEERHLIQGHRNRALFLKKRAEKAGKMSISEKRAVVSEKMKLIGKRLNQEIILLNLQLSNMEETIIRQGCPSSIF